MRCKVSGVWALAAALLLVGAAHGGNAPTFTYGWDGCPAEMKGTTGEVRTFDIYATLKVENNTAAIGPGGWTMSIAIAGTGGVVKSQVLKGVIVDAIYEEDGDGDPGTPLDHYDHYDFNLASLSQKGNAFFAVVQPATADYDWTGVTPPPPSKDLRGIIVAEVMGSETLAVLQPNGTNKVVKMTIEATCPADFTLKFIDNMKGQGVPTTNAVTFDSNPYGFPQGLVAQECHVSFKDDSVVTPCSQPDYAVYFGSEAKADAFNIAGADNVKVGVRNKSKGWGFGLGVQKNGANLEFFEEPASLPALELEFVIPDGELAKSVPLAKGNTATGAPQDQIGEVVVGAALTGNAPGHYLAVGIDATGAKAKIGYISDTGDSGKEIAATTDNAQTGACGIQEILIVKFKTVVQLPKFSRGDANGDTKINVTDAVVIAQNIFATKLVFFDCKAMLDVNDDGSLNTGDPVDLLKYIFMNGAVPPAPFRTCATDETSLECKAPNCQ